MRAQLATVATGDSGLPNALSATGSLENTPVLSGNAISSWSVMVTERLLLAWASLPCSWKNWYWLWKDHCQVMTMLTFSRTGLWNLPWLIERNNCRDIDRNWPIAGCSRNVKVGAAGDAARQEKRFSHKPWKQWDDYVWGDAHGADLVGGSLR